MDSIVRMKKAQEVQVAGSRKSGVERRNPYDDPLLAVPSKGQSHFEEDRV